MSQTFWKISNLFVQSTEYLSKSLGGVSVSLYYIIFKWYFRATFFVPSKKGHFKHPQTITLPELRLTIGMGFIIKK